MPGVCSLPVLGPAACGAVTGAAKSALSGIFGDIAKAFVGAEVEALKFLTTSFLDVPTPTVGGAGGAAGWLQGQLTWIVVATATAGLIVAAGRMIWSRKVQPATEAFAGVLRLVIVTGCGVAAVSLLTTASDSFAKYLIGASTSDPSASLAAMASVTVTSFTSPALVSIVAVLGIIGSLVQIALLYVRGALIVVLVGVWPLSTAASLVAGSQWHKKVTGWLLAAVLYKFAAAIIFATAFRLLTGTSGGVGSIDGIVLLLLGCLCLPALLKLTVPMVGAVGGIGAAQAIGTAAGVATGAAIIAGGAGVAASAATHAPGLISKGAGSGGGSPDGATMAPPSPSSGGTGGGVKVAAQTQTAFAAVHDTAEKITDGAAAPA
jgi:type IV secretion system protein TrbL